MATIRGILTFIDAHPSLPTTLSIYLQFILNCFLTGLLILMIYKGFSVISNDINERAIMESSEIIAEMASCAHEYHENRCERDSRVPAMEMVCNNWEKCMARDPYKVGRSRLSAGMFAEIFNSFIEPISFKAIVRLPPHPHSLSPYLRRNLKFLMHQLQIVVISVIVLCFVINNMSFGLWRSRHPPPPPHPSYAYHAPPQQQMGFPPGSEHYYNHFGNHMGLQHAAHQGGHSVEGGSPMKRLGNM